MIILKKLFVFLGFWSIVFQTQAETDGQQSGSSKIVGGQEAISGQFPYQGFLTAVINSVGVSCGCSLIATNWVITAAHCTVGASSTRVAFGQINVMLISSSDMIEVAAIYNHPGYNSVTLSNDISLLQLRSHVQISSLASLIALPPAGETVPPNTSCLISGFGTTDELSMQSSNTLRWASVPIVSFSECAAVYGNVIDFLHLCAGFANGGVDSCQGDSGGPLSCTSSSGQELLQGITSFGRGCARPGIPGVYTRVSSYIDWIRDTILTAPNLTSSSGKIAFSFSTYILLLVIVLIF